MFLTFSPVVISPGVATAFLLSLQTVFLEHNVALGSIQRLFAQLQQSEDMRHKMCKAVLAWPLLLRF